MNFLVIGKILVRLLSRPGLWWTFVLQVAGLVPTGWWRQAPFLPVPPQSYLEFRTGTLAGKSGPAGSNLDDAVLYVDYLRWCKAMRSLT